MFDAKALLEQITGNIQRPSAAPSASGAPGDGLNDLYSQIAAAVQS